MKHSSKQKIDQNKNFGSKSSPNTNITEEAKRRFSALRDPHYTNFALLSVFVNDEPTTAIASVHDNEFGGKDLCIMFVATTPSMKIKDHDGRETQVLYGIESRN